MRTFSGIINNFNFEFEIAMARFDEQMKQITQIKDENQNFPMLLAPNRVPETNLTPYDCGHRGKCLITYIQNIERDLCFIVDIER